MLHLGHDNCIFFALDRDGHVCVRKHLAFYFYHIFCIEDTLVRLDHWTFLCLACLFHFLGNGHQVQELYQHLAH